MGVTQNCSGAQLQMRPDVWHQSSSDSPVLSWRRLMANQLCGSHDVHLFVRVLDDYSVLNNGLQGTWGTDVRQQQVELFEPCGNKIDCHCRTVVVMEIRKMLSLKLNHIAMLTFWIAWMYRSRADVIHLLCMLPGLTDLVGFNVRQHNKAIWTQLPGKVTGSGG